MSSPLDLSPRHPDKRRQLVRDKMILETLLPMKLTSSGRYFSLDI